MISVPFTSSVVPVVFSLPFVTTFAFFTICTTLAFSVSSRFFASSSGDSLFTRFCSSEVPSPLPFDEPVALFVEAELFEDPLFALVTIKLLLLLRVFAC